MLLSEPEVARAGWRSSTLTSFLFSPGPTSLPDLLVEYEEHPGVVVNWQVYGSSGLMAKPDSLVIESFVQRARIGSVTGASRASWTRRASCGRLPHFFEYADGALAVTEGHEPVRVIGVRSVGATDAARTLTAATDRDGPVCDSPSSVKQVSVGRLRLNHYAVRSRQEFEQKTARHARVSRRATSPTTTETKFTIPH
jgi:hypothetical protein